MSVFDTLRNRGLLKHAEDLDSENDDASSEEEDDLDLEADSEEDDKDDTSEEFDGPSRPSIAVYAERTANRIESFVRHDLVTDQPAEVLAEILAHVVKHLENKGYHNLKAPTLDANRTASASTGLMSSVRRYHASIRK